MNTPALGSLHLSLPLLLLLAKATIILLAALGITLTMQRTSAGARHLVWLVTLATLLLVPALTAWGPVKVAVLDNGYGATSTNDERVASNEYRVTSKEVPVAREAGGSVPDGAQLPTPVARDAASAPAYSSLVARYSFSSLLLAAWALIAAAILASLAWSGLAVRRIVRQASPLEHESWRTPLYEVADRMGLADAPRLLKSDSARMPFACGIVTPTIVLPAECDAWTLERRRAVLLHELAHVRRHDLLGHTLGRLACALYWFHPLVWTAARRLRDESERACDDLALSCGTRATDYAEHLLDIVTSVRKDATPSVALAMARRKEFEGRMLAILDPDLRRVSPSRRQSAALIGALALVALTVSAISPVARPAEAAQAAAASPPRADTAHFDRDSRLTGPVRTSFRSETTFRSDTAFHQAIAHSTSIAQSAASSHADAFASAVGSFASVVAETTLSAVAQALRAPGLQAQHDEGISATARASRDNAREIRQLIGGAAQNNRPADDRAALLARVLATDTSASLRRVAAWGLHEYATQPVATEALANALRKDASPAVREMAAWALGEGDEHNGTATSALAAALKSDTDEKVRATAAWALGEVGDRGSVDALVAALSSGSAAVRTRALWAIGNVEPRQAPREVIALLRDPEPRVRQLAAWALFQIEDPAAATALKDAIGAEQDKDVQLAEIRALGALGEKSVEALKALVDSPDPRMRSMAVHALAGGSASGPWPWPWPQPRPFP